MLLMGLSWSLPLSLLWFLLQSLPGVCEPGAFWMKLKQQMDSRSKSYALHLPMRFQATEQTKRACSLCPPWNQWSHVSLSKVADLSILLPPFWLPLNFRTEVVFLWRPYWGWTQILLWFHAVSYLLGTRGFGSGSQKLPDESTGCCYPL